MVSRISQPRKTNLLSSFVLRSHRRRRKENPARLSSSKDCKS
jgi:hypothetical protein